MNLDIVRYKENGIPSLRLRFHEGKIENGRQLLPTINYLTLKPEILMNSKIMLYTSGRLHDDNFDSIATSGSFSSSIFKSLKSDDDTLYHLMLGQIVLTIIDSVYAVSDLYNKSIDFDFFLKKRIWVNEELVEFCKDSIEYFKENINKEH